MKCQHSAEIHWNVVGQVRWTLLETLRKSQLERERKSSIAIDRSHCFFSAPKKKCSHANTVSLAISHVVHMPYRIRKLCRNSRWELHWAWGMHLPVHFTDAGYSSPKLRSFPKWPDHDEFYASRSGQFGADGFGLGSRLHWNDDGTLYLKKREFAPRPTSDVIIYRMRRRKKLIIQGTDNGCCDVTVQKIKKRKK